MYFFNFASCESLNTFIQRFYIFIVIITAKANSIIIILMINMINIINENN